MKLNLKIKLGKLELATPLICASGTFGFGDELKGLVNYKNIGAVITKTITNESRPGNPPPRIFETACGIINSVGLENPGIEAFVAEKLPLLKKVPTKHIVSIGGFTVEDYQILIKRLNEKSTIHAFEVNLSCPNLKVEPLPERGIKKLISQNERATYQLTKALRRLTKKPLFIKITPEVTDSVKIAKAAQEAGADAVSLVNTFFSLAVNIQTQSPYLGSTYGGYSGRAIKPLSLFRVWRLSKELKIPIIAGGGIENASDAIEFILAGASAISLGTINLVYPNAAERILKGIKEYMKQKKINDINELRGKLNEPKPELE